MSEGTVVPLGALLPVLAERAGGGAAVIVDDVVLTAPALAAEVAGLAARLADAGITAGDRVALAMPNGIGFIESFLAISSLGGVVVPVNLRYHPQEVARLVRHAGARHVVAEGAGVDLATAAAVDAGVAVIAVTERVTGFAGPLPVHHADPHDVAVILYTSGTTSAPKGCRLTHEALVRTGSARIAERRLADPEVVWTPCPLFHVGALVPLIGCLDTGSTFVTTAEFDATAAVRQLQEHGVTTALPLFPAFTDAMVDELAVGDTELPALRQILTTGVPHAVERAVEAFAPALLVSAYGMTELCGVMASSPVDESVADRLTYDGTPFAGIEVRTVDPETGAPQPAGAVGELSVRGWCCCAGYLDDPAATAAAFDADGWFRTGDMGQVDADGTGRIRFLGRFKDMLKVGGENVGASEVEKVIGRHPGVRHVEVVGVPDERLGEVVGAFVELEPGHEHTSADGLIEHCRQQIARFKVPRRVWFVAADEWPRSATKVDKNALRRRAQMVDA